MNLECGLCSQTFEDAASWKSHRYEHRAHPQKTLFIASKKPVATQKENSKSEEDKHMDKKNIVVRGMKSEVSQKRQSFAVNSKYQSGKIHNTTQTQRKQKTVPHYPYKSGSKVSQMKAGVTRAIDKKVHPVKRSFEDYLTSEMDNKCKRPRKAF